MSLATKLHILTAAALTLAAALLVDVALAVWG